MTSREPLRAAMLLLGLATACAGDACGPGVLGDLPATDVGSGDGGVDTSSGDASAEGAGVDETGDPPLQWSTVAQQHPRQVDVLMVIDNGGPEMGARQARLVATASSLLDALDGVQASYRIGFTTTEVYGPGCATDTFKLGELVAKSCRERLGQFRLGDLDLSDVACRDHCAHDEIERRVSTTELDPRATQRGWMERIDGESNVVVDPAEAFACLAPQGIDGCTFAEPLAAVWWALDQVRQPISVSYGFLRERASLFVVVVTDGADCSPGPDGFSIFATPEDCEPADVPCTQTFWTDPEAAAPTEGVCWNAGVACSGAAPGPNGTTEFASCVAANKDKLGGEAEPNLGVLISPETIATRLAELRDEKAWLGRPVELIAIAGYPQNADASPSFATAADPAEQLAWGIAPSCRDDDGVGIHPVRIDRVMAVLDQEPRRTSICADDYSSAFQPILDSVRAQLVPACLVDVCAADLDPGTPVAEVDCQVREEVPFPDREEHRAVPQCLPGSVLPEGVDVCWVPIVDRSHATADVTDDMNELCVEAGSNLELLLVRRDGHPAIDGTSIEVACVPSEQPEIDCPGL